MLFLTAATKKTKNKNVVIFSSKYLLPVKRYDNFKFQPISSIDHQLHIFFAWPNEIVLNYFMMIDLRIKEYRKSFDIAFSNNSHITGAIPPNVSRGIAHLWRPRGRGWSFGLPIVAIAWTINKHWTYCLSYRRTCWECFQIYMTPINKKKELCGWYW